ncbi:hypothetical protein [Dubosiella newyorkensis]|uniref:hypothetical protein n=1 Tax=Dubosiella newyorkensis TaxID=1862672 RepID=UPI003F665A4C
MSAIVHIHLKTFKRCRSLDPQACKKKCFASSNEGILKLLKQTILDEVLRSVYERLYKRCISINTPKALHWLDHSFLS